MIDPGSWTKGRRDIIKGGQGADTFVIKDDYYAFIKDFKITEDRFDILGLASGFDWDIRFGNTYIYNESEEKIVKINGRMDLSIVQTVG